MLTLVFGIIGIAAIVVFAIQVYKTALSTERNAASWTLLTIFVGLAFQYLVPFAVGMAIGIYAILSGTPLERLQHLIGLLTVVDVVALVVSVPAMAMISKTVAKVKDEPTGGNTSPAPPPPPSFGATN